MIKRSGTSTNTARVTFELPSTVAAAAACVCGEFNDWSSEALPMTRTTDGRFEATVELAGGRRWRFRYLLDGACWENDWAADDYVANDFGGEDSVVDLSALPTAAPDEPPKPSRRTGAPADQDAAVNDINATKKTTTKKKAATKIAAAKETATTTIETLAKDLKKKATAKKAGAKKAATRHEPPRETATMGETAEE